MGRYLSRWLCRAALENNGGQITWAVLGWPRGRETRAGARQHLGNGFCRNHTVDNQHFSICASWQRNSMTNVTPLPPVNDFFSMFNSRITILQEHPHASIFMAALGRRSATGDTPQTLIPLVCLPWRHFRTCCWTFGKRSLVIFS